MIEVISTLSECQDAHGYARVHKALRRDLSHEESAHAETIERVKVEMSVGPRDRGCHDAVVGGVDQLHRAAADAALDLLAYAVVVAVAEHAPVERHAEDERIRLNVVDHRVAANHIGQLRPANLI